MTRWMILAVAIVAGMFAVSGLASTVYFDRFPELVATHWNAAGQPDAFTPRDHVFFVFYLFPTIALVVMGLALILPWMSPQRFKVDTFRGTYDYVFALVAGLLAWMHVTFLVSSAAGSLHDRWLVIGIFVFFGLMGNVLGKVRPNFWMGVRTPWTLASDVVWEKTHRLAAWLFVSASLFGIVAAIYGLPVLWCFLMLPIAALAPVLYSLVLYKKLEKAGQLESGN